MLKVAAAEAVRTKESKHSHVGYEKEMSRVPARYYATFRTFVETGTRPVK